MNDRNELSIPSNNPEDWTDEYLAGELKGRVKDISGMLKELTKRGGTVKAIMVPERTAKTIIIEPFRHISIKSITIKKEL